MPERVAERGPAAEHDVPLLDEAGHQGGVQRGRDLGSCQGRMQAAGRDGLDLGE